jgi:hypothetical protein
MQFLPPSCRFPPLREGNRFGFPCLQVSREGNQKGAVPLPAGFPYCVRGTRKARFPLPAGGT